jgi:hypothetical protein
MVGAWLHPAVTKAIATRHANIKPLPVCGIGGEVRVDLGRAHDQHCSKIAERFDQRGGRVSDCR